MASIIDAIKASMVLLNTKVTYGGTAAKLRSLFHGRKFLKLLKRRTVGQAVPEIPLSGRQQARTTFVFAKFPYTSPYTHAFVRVFILPCIILHVYIGYIQCT